MIELNSLTKSYVTKGGRKYVFKDLSCIFPSDVSIGLIGRNGAGKSTLLRLIGGIDTPDRGFVYTEKKISWPVGLQGSFQGSLTARDNVKFVCRIYGYDGHEMQEKIKFVEWFSEVGDYFDKPIKTFSSGMRARVAFGLSMAFDFDYLLIDEVMATGDAHFQKKSKEVMADKCKNSKLILVSHNMKDIKNYCNVVLLVQDGRVLVFDDVDEGIKSYQNAS